MYFESLWNFLLLSLICSIRSKTRDLHNTNLNWVTFYGLYLTIHLNRQDVEHMKCHRKKGRKTNESKKEKDFEKMTVISSSTHCSSHHLSSSFCVPFRTIEKSDNLNLSYEPWECQYQIIAWKSGVLTHDSCRDSPRDITIWRIMI